MGKRLTSESVEALRRPKVGYTLTWDSEVRGFGVRVTAAGAKSFVLFYRTLGGRQRRITLGPHPALTASEARRRARAELGKVAEGRDPRLERVTERAHQLRTFAALADLYLESLRARVQPPTDRTLRLYERDYLGRFLLPTFGARPVHEVTREDLRKLHRKVGEESGRYLANRVLQLVSGLAKYGEAIGWWPGGKGLTVGLDRFREASRISERSLMLSAEQMARLLTALDEADAAPGANPYALACIRFLLWSGWRPEEAFNLQWGDVELKTGRVRLTRTKTRADGEERILLAEAVAVLESVPRIVGYPYVFAGNKPRRPLTHVNRTWRALRKATELEDLGGNLGPMRLRDLRHNFIAQHVNRGADLGMVGRMVGHKSRASTARYGGFAPDLLRAIGDEGFAALRRDMASATRDRSTRAKVAPEERRS